VFVCDADTNPDADCHTDAIAIRFANTDSIGYSNADADCNTDTDGFTNTNPIRFANTYGYADSSTNAGDHDGAV
jgi:hypothetical protein